VALLALALAGSAAATPRIAIAPVKGDVRDQVGGQLVRALCGLGDCLRVAPIGDRPDLARARVLGAEGFLVGSIWRERGGRVLSLALFTTGTRPERTWVLPLGADGLLSGAQLEQLAAAMATVRGARPPVAATAPSRPAVLPAPPRVPSPDRPPAPGPWFAAEAGVEPAHLSLRFPGGGTAPVGYAVDLPVAPRLRIELSPLHPAGGRAAGLALFADATWQPGIDMPAGANHHQADYLRLRGGLLWRLAMARWLVLLPALAWERESLVVHPSGGVRVPGLPDTRLTGGSIALGLEVPLGGPRLTLLAGGRAAWWTGAGELAGGSSFFPGGSAHTLEAEAGAALALAGPLSLRALVRYAATTWTLEVDPSGAYTARSALAESWGGRVTLRLEL
jgi:hypothetical protein